MSKIRIDGKVLEALPNTQFIVEISENNKLRSYLSGKMKINNITVLVGDMVILEVEDKLQFKDQIGRIIRRK